MRKKMRLQHANGHCGAPRARHAPPLWIVLGVMAVAALSAVPWALRSRTAVQAAQRALANEMGLRDDTFRTNLATGALLHDVGKIGPGVLTFSWKGAAADAERVAAAIAGLPGAHVEGWNVEE